jgi:hypothetical protein
MGRVDVRRIRSVLRRARDERGATLILVALALPALLLMSSLSIDVANWFSHKRHLQMQADAGALAAGARFGVLSACSDATIRGEAYKYGGDVNQVPAAYNAQVGGNNVPTATHVLVNKRTYFGQPGNVDSTVDETKGPCAAGFVDTKVTETSLPWYLGGDLVPNINAHARVALFQVDSLKGSLPIGVPAGNPRSARAVVWDETSGACFKDASAQCYQQDLTAQPEVGGVIHFTNKNGTALPVKFNTTHTLSVRVNLGGGTSTDCADPLVRCYDLQDTNKGLVYLNTWQDSTQAAAQQPNPPKLKGVRLLPVGAGTCGTSFANGSCPLQVEADVNFGTASGVDPTTASSVGAQVRAKFNGGTYPMTWSSATKKWTTSATTTPVTVPPAGGPLDVTVEWAETNGNLGARKNCSANNPFTNANDCNGSFGVAQRAYGADSARSGPITSMQVNEDTGALNVNSFQACDATVTTCTHNLLFDVGVIDQLQPTPYGSASPPIKLRLTGSGSQTQALNCDPSNGQGPPPPADFPTIRGYSDELAYGCWPGYKKNAAQDCSATPTASALWSTPLDWPCVAITPGGKPSDIGQGFNLRILGAEKPTSCTSPNHWLDPSAPIDHDPRLIPLMITPFNSFGGSGSGTVPVVDFGAFYVTGWQGNAGFTNPCQNPQSPAYLNDDSAQAGEVVGHFVSFAVPAGSGDGSAPCDTSGISLCIAQLVQ